MKRNIVYKADVETGGVVRSYIGQTTRTFKQRAGTHLSNIRTGRKATTLATHVTDLRQEGIVDSNITWTKVKEINPRRKGERICGLCNMEKTYIAAGDPAVLLNKRTEIMERCRHRDNLVLTNNLSRERRVRPRVNNVADIRPPKSPSSLEESPVITTVAEPPLLENEEEPCVINNSTPLQTDQPTQSSSSVPLPILQPEPNSFTVNSIPYLLPVNREDDPAHPSSTVPPADMVRPGSQGMEDEQSRSRRRRCQERIDYRKFY